MSLVQIILRFAAICFVAEGLNFLAHPTLTTLLESNGIHSELGLLIVNAVALVLIACPLVYFWIIRPYMLAQHNAEAMLRDAIESISEGFLMYDSDDRLALCNTRFREIYAVAEDIFVPGRKFEDILRAGVERGQYPDAKGNEEDWIAKRLRLHQELQEPIERQLPDGRWVKIAEKRTSSGGTVGIRTDITDLKTREHQLRDSEDRLRRVVESLQEGFVLYDSEDRIVIWNDKWLDLHKEVADIIDSGVTFENLTRTCVARRLYSVQEGREEEFIANRIAQHRNPGEPFVRQLNDGRWFVIREVRTAEGGTFALNIDITDLKKAENAAEEARQEAEMANSAKSEFLASMSHDLRTPLNAIIGFSDFISQQYFGPVGGKYQEYAKDIKSSGELLLSLVNDILDLSAIESGKQSLNKENIALADIVAECEAIIKARAQSFGIELVTNVQKDSPPLYADRRATIQILINLLSNAIKFTPEGGKITLRATATNEHNTIEVSDTGIGIPADKIAIVTEPFVMGGTNPHKTRESTGLGLAIVKSLMDLHDGKLNIKSTVGKGTAVMVTFPNGAP